MVKTIGGGVRKARRLRHCFECYREIAPGQDYAFQTNVYDGTVYTLAWHIDCGCCGSEYRRICAHYYDDDEGFPPLRDEWLQSGEYEHECDRWRGLYPHVVARMELSDQLREARGSANGDT